MKNSIYTIAFVMGLCITTLAQERSPARVIAGANFAMDVYNHSESSFVNRVPHLKSLSFNWGLSTWYWTGKRTVIAATTALNVELNIDIVGFTMIMPDGGGRLITFEEAGINKPRGYSLTQMDLSVDLSKIGAKGTVSFAISGSMYGQLNTNGGFLNYQEKIYEFSNRKENLNKSFSEIMSALDPQVSFIKKPEFLDFSFPLGAIDTYIKKIYSEYDIKEKERVSNMAFDSLIREAEYLENQNQWEVAIQKYEEALAIKDQLEIKERLKSLKDKIKERSKQQEIDTLLSQAKEAESHGELEKAKSIYQEAANKSDNPSIQNEIARIEIIIKEKENLKGQHQAQENNISQTTQLDYWGNPVNRKNNTVNYNGLEVEDNSTYQQQMQLRQYNAVKKESWEQEEALKRQKVDTYNANLVQQSNNLYQQSLNIDKDMNDALSQISPETYGDPKLMIQTGMNLLSTANGNLGQAYTGAALGGVGIAAGLLGDLAKAKAKKEAAAERARIRKEAEAKKKAIRESIKKARLAVFNGYPQGQLPLSSTSSKGNNLYYFAYTYNHDHLLLDNPKVKVTSVFAIGKYPDGTWPMKTKIEGEVNDLTPLKETICGPFYSLGEANSVYQSFIGYMDKTNMGIDAITYEGFNAHSESESLQQAAPKVDFWGNPIKN